MKINKDQVKGNTARAAGSIMGAARRITPAAIVATGLLLAVVGCAKQESAAQTRADVARAQTAGDKSVAIAQGDASDKMAKADEGVAKAQDEAARTSAGTSRDMTIADAEAAHNVALARCEAQSGRTRTDCKNVANSDLAAAKAHAEATKEAQAPTP